MFDLKVGQFPVVPHITGRKRLIIYFVVLLAASLTFWHLVHAEHSQQVLQAPAAGTETVFTASH